MVRDSRNYSGANNATVLTILCTQYTGSTPRVRFFEPAARAGHVRLRGAAMSRHYPGHGSTIRAAPRGPNASISEYRAAAEIKAAPPAQGTRKTGPSPPPSCGCNGCEAARCETPTFEIHHRTHTSHLSRSSRGHLEVTTCETVSARSESAFPSESAPAACAARVAAQRS